MSKQNNGKKVVLIGHLYENMEGIPQNDHEKGGVSKEEMGKFLLSIPKDLRRTIKFESEEQGFKNSSSYICHILVNREHFISNEE